MLIFSDEILKKCSAAELASLLTVANTHGVKAITDEASQNHDALKAYIQKRGKEEAEEAEYTKRLEENFM